MKRILSISASAEAVRKAARRASVDVPNPKKLIKVKEIINPILPKEISPELPETLPEVIIPEEIVEMIKPSEIKEDIIPHIDIVKTPNNEISKLKSISQQIDEHKAEIDDKIKELTSVEDIMANHADWIDKYEDKSGKKAIWKGVITNGFKEFIELNGLE